MIKTEQGRKQSKNTRCRDVDLKRKHDIIKGLENTSGINGKTIEMKQKQKETITLIGLRHMKVLG